MNRMIVRYAPYVLLLLTLLSCLGNDSVADNTPPAREPYVGEWHGDLIRVGLGQESEVEVSVILGSTPNTLNCSVWNITENNRVNFTATWNPGRGGFEATADNTNFLISLAGNSLKLDTSNERLGNYTSTLSDARNLWVGNWTGTIACVDGSEASIAWTIQKGAGRTDLRISSTARPNTVLSNPNLSQNAIKGEFADDAGKVYVYEASYVHFTGLINVGATVKGTTAGCTLGLRK